jgi:hypothetical protein
MPYTSESRVIAAAPADIWSAITDLERAARWNRNWQRVEYLGTRREGVDVSFRAHTEDGLAHEFRISEWTQEELVTFVPVRDDAAEPRYMITLVAQTFRLRSLDEERTDVILSAEAAGHGLRGWLAARFVWPAYQRQGLRSALDSLQALFEPLEDNGDEAGEEDPDDVLGE